MTSGVKGFGWFVEVGMLVLGAELEGRGVLVAEGADDFAGRMLVDGVFSRNSFFTCFVVRCGVLGGE